MRVAKRRPLRAVHTSDVHLGGPGRRSIGEATQQRRLLPADVLRQIAPGEGLLIHGTLPPAHIRAQRYWEDPRLTQIANGHGPTLPPWTLPPARCTAGRNWASIQKSS